MVQIIVNYSKCVWLIAGLVFATGCAGITPTSTSLPTPAPQVAPWSSNEGVLPRTPLWEAWWFRGLIGGLLIAGAIAGYRFRLRDIRQRNRTLEKRLDEYTWALRQQTQELERQQQQLQALYQADEELHHHLHLNEVLQALTNIAVDLLKADKSAVLTWDKTRERLTMRVARGFGESALEHLHFKRGEMVAGHVLETGEAIIVEDTATDPRMAQQRAEIARAAQAENIRSLMHLPIKIGEEIFGVFNVSYRQPHAFGAAEQQLFTALAHRAAFAIESARHFDAEQRRAEQFRVMSEVSHDITAILDVSRLLQEIVSDIQNAFGYQSVGIGLIEGDEVVLKAGISALYSKLPLPPLRLRVGEQGIMGRVAGTGEPLLVPDLRQDSRHIQWPKDIGSLSELAVPLKTQTGVIGVLNVESNQLNAFDQSDLMVLQSLANQAAVAIENAQRFHVEKRRAEQFQIIAEIGRRVSSLLDTDQITQQVTQLLRQAFDYYHVGIGLIEGDEVVYRVGSGHLWDNPAFGFKPARLKIGKEGLAGWVAAHGEPLIIPDVSQEPRYVLMQGSATRSEITVPIIVKDDVIGVFDVQSDQLNAFDQTDLAVAQSIANQTGAAIENARLYERAQELAVMQERNRLARDLHDAVTQTLFSASLIADALPSTWDNDPTQGRQLLKELRQLSRGALAEMRTLLLELRPAALVETNLDSLLRQLCEAAAGRAGLLISVNVTSGCKLPPDAHIALYRIAQEALNNILKHARATNVAVELNCHAIDPGQIVELSIRDDGRGFDPDHVPPNHFGLGNMRERAQAIGAELQVTSQPGRGTRIQVGWKNKEGTR